MNLLQMFRDTVTVRQGCYITNGSMSMLASQLHAVLVPGTTGDLPGYTKTAAEKMFDDLGTRFEVMAGAAKIAAYLDPRTK